MIINKEEHILLINSCENTCQENSVTPINIYINLKLTSSII